eukprot:tig00020961_g16655.t1
MDVESACGKDGPGERGDDPWGGGGLEQPSPRGAGGRRGRTMRLDLFVVLPSSASPCMDSVITRVPQGLFVLVASVAISVTLRLAGAAKEAAEQLRASLDASLQLTAVTALPRASWIGAAAASGLVRAATGGLLEGRDVSARPWFSNAQRGSGYLGDVHTAVLLQSLLAPNASEPIRFVDVAVPMRLANGSVSHVLALHLHWEWAREVSRRVMSPLYSDAELFVFSPGDTLLLSPNKELWAESAAPYPAPKCAGAARAAASGRPYERSEEEWAAPSPPGRYLAACSALRWSGIDWVVATRAPVPALRREAVLVALLGGAACVLLALASRSSAPPSPPSSRGPRARPGPAPAPATGPAPTAPGARKPKSPHVVLCLEPADAGDAGAAGAPGARPGTPAGTAATAPTARSLFATTEADPEAQAGAAQRPSCFGEVRALQEGIGGLRAAIRRYASLERTAARLERAVRQRTAELAAANAALRREAAEREAAQEALAGARAAKAASLARAGVVASVNHELRTPLNAICGFTRILLDEVREAGQRECLETIWFSAQTILDLVADILDVTKLESGKMRVLAEPFALEEVLEESVGLVAVKAAEKGLALQHTLRWAPAAGRPRRLLGDAGRLRQILMARPRPLTPARPRSPEAGPALAEPPQQRGQIQ